MHVKNKHQTTSPPLQKPPKLNIRHVGLAVVLLVVGVGAWYVDAFLFIVLLIIGSALMTTIEKGEQK
jgi:hypothetical protein